MTTQRRRLGGWMLLLALLVPLLPAAAHAAPAPPLFVERDGRVVIETEDYASQTAGQRGMADAQWRAGDGYRSATDGVAMVAGPNQGRSAKAEPIGAALHYPVLFSTPGTWYVFVRAYASSEPARDHNDSVHIAFAGRCVTCRGYGLSSFAKREQFNWQGHVQGDAVTITVPRAGTYDLALLMREDGVVVDKIWLDRNPNAVRDDDTQPGPPARGRGAPAANPAPPAQPITRPTAPPAQPVTQKTRTVTLAPAADDAVVQNPLSGLYRWMGNNEPVPVGPSVDIYKRIEWSDLERGKGEYTFAILDRELAAAAKDNRRFAFRVRAVVSGEGRSTPRYLDDMISNDYWDRDAYVPDWNDQDFLDRAEALLAALGQRYDGDPRLAFVDIGIYGNWGEWHMHAFTRSNGAGPITTASKQRIVDMHLRAFTKTPLVMLSDDQPMLVYALNQRPTIGWRRDSLGTDHFDNLEQKLKAEVGEAGWQLVRDRWKTAPVITEFYNPSAHRDPDTYRLAVAQAKRWHISLVGNGNMLKGSALSSAGKRTLIDLHRTLGYRVGVDTVTTTATWQRGQSVQVQTQWRNRGVAPPYEPWTATVQLRTAQGAVLWELPLDITSTALHPGAQPTWTAQGTVPTSLASGTYTLTIAASNGTQAIVLDNARQQGTAVVASTVTVP